MQVWLIKKTVWGEASRPWLEVDAELGVYATRELAEAEVDRLNAAIAARKVIYDEAVVTARREQVRAAQVLKDAGVRGTLNASSFWPSRPADIHDTFAVGEAYEVRDA